MNTIIMAIFETERTNIHILREISLFELFI